MDGISQYVTNPSGSQFLLSIVTFFDRHVFLQVISYLNILWFFSLNQFCRDTQFSHTHTVLKKSQSYAREV